MQKPQVSIIIVHYSRQQILFDCIASILKNTKSNIEIIIVDNGNKEIKSKLLRISRKIIYIKSLYNIGYAAGNNFGAKKAIGKVLLILNPDTLIVDDSVTILANYINNNHDVGLVGPKLLDRKLNPYQQIGIRELSPLRAVFVLSILSKILPNNRFLKEYWKNCDQKEPISVDIVGGSVMAINRELYNKIGGFDENFFLYFEEVDLCKRLKDKGYKIMVFPQAKFIHFWKATTPKKPYIKRIFLKSRFYYFKKHYGFFKAVTVEFFTRISAKHIFAGAIFLSICILAQLF